MTDFLARLVLRSVRADVGLRMRPASLFEPDSDAPGFAPGSREVMAERPLGTMPHAIGAGNELPDAAPSASPTGVAPPPAISTRLDRRRSALEGRETPRPSRSTARSDRALPPAHAGRDAPVAVAPRHEFPSTDRGDEIERRGDISGGHDTTARPAPPAAASPERGSRPAERPEALATATLEAERPDGASERGPDAHTVDDGVSAIQIDRVREREIEHRWETATQSIRHAHHAIAPPSGVRIGRGQAPRPAPGRHAPRLRRDGAATSAGADGSAPSTVQVTIGRVEVRATGNRTAPAVPRRVEPAMPLEQYLRARNGETRR